MTLKKVAWIFSGLVLSINVATAWTAPVSPDGTFKETLDFSLAASSKAFCTKPVPLDVIATRHHSSPDRKTVFAVQEPSPYAALVILASDPHNPTVKIRHYTDQLTFKASAVVMTLNGTKDASASTNGGTWTASDGCHGRFIVR